MRQGIGAVTVVIKNILKLARRQEMMLTAGDGDILYRTVSYHRDALKIALEAAGAEGGIAGVGDTIRTVALVVAPEDLVAVEGGRHEPPLREVQSDERDLTGDGTHQYRLVVCGARDGLNGPPARAAVERTDVIVCPDDVDHAAAWRAEQWKRSGAGRAGVSVC